MPKRSSTGRLDLNQLAKRIVDEATDEAPPIEHKPEKNKAAQELGRLGYGDCYTWTAIDADTKLAISWLVGRRDVEYAEAFMADLASEGFNELR